MSFLSGAPRRARVRAAADFFFLAGERRSATRSGSCHPILVSGASAVADSERARRRGKYLRLCA